MEDSIGVKESPLEKSPRKSDNVGILKVPNFLEVLECAVLPSSRDPVYPRQ